MGLLLAAATVEVAADEPPSTFERHGAEIRGCVIETKQRIPPPPTRYEDHPSMWEGPEAVAVLVAEANLADVASIKRDDRSELTRARLILHPAERGPDAHPWQRVTLRRPDGTAPELPWPPKPIELSDMTLVQRNVLTVVLPTGLDGRRLEAAIRAAHAACRRGGR